MYSSGYSLYTRKGIDFMRAVIYLRVSTEDQVKGYSLDDQRESCRKKAEDLGATIIEEFEDDAISGSILNRPGLDDALDRIKEVKTDYFVCLDPDRFARKLAVQIITTEEIEKAHTQPVFINFDWKNTPEGRLFYSLRGAIAEYEVEKIKERSRRGKYQKAKQGKMTHNPFIYGYDLDKETSSLVANPEQVRILQMMFSWVADERISYNEVATRLNSMGIPSPKNKKWQRATAKRILQNPAYLGVVYLNRYNSEGVKFNKYKPESERVYRTIRPKEEWLPVNVPKLIDEKLWFQVQEVLANARRLKPGYALGEYLLSGLITCGVCNSPFNGTRAISKTGKYYNRYYRCTSKSKVHKVECNLPFTNADKIESEVWEMVKSIIMNPQLFAEEVTGNKGNSTRWENELFEIEEMINKSAEEKERLIYLYQKGIVKMADIEKGLDDIQSRMTMLNTRARQLEYQMARSEISAEQLQYLKNIGARYGDLDKIGFEDKQQLIRMVVSNIVITADQNHVYIKSFEQKKPVNLLEDSYNPAYRRSAFSRSS